MKIIIKPNEQRFAIRLWFPTRMLFSKTTARIVIRSMKRSAKQTETIVSKVKENVLEDVDTVRIADTIRTEVDNAISAEIIANKVKEDILNKVNSARINETIRAKVDKAIGEKLDDVIIEPIDGDPGSEYADEDLGEAAKSFDEDQDDDSDKTINKKPWKKSKSNFSLEQMLTHLPEEKVIEAMRVLRRMKKDHPGVPLVDVRSAEGDRVLIKL